MMHKLILLEKTGPNHWAGVNYQLWLNFQNHMKQLPPVKGYAELQTQMNNELSKFKCTYVMRGEGDTQDYLEFPDAESLTAFQLAWS